MMAWCSGIQWPKIFGDSKVDFCIGLSFLVLVFGVVVFVELISILEACNGEMQNWNNISLCALFSIT